MEDFCGDESVLPDLQARLRQAREKNFSLLRREGAARVEAEGARGAAQPANEKRGEKVDVLAEALDRVTQQLEAIGSNKPQHLYRYYRSSIAV